MLTTTLTLTAALLVSLTAACTPGTVDQGEEDSTGASSSSGTGSTGDVEDIGGSTSTGDGEIGSSTGDEGSTNSTSTGDEGTSSTGDGSTMDVSTGEGSSSTGDGPGMVCGDGVEDLYEVCDDGTPGGGDGCSADCRRWDWHGIAKDVPEVALINWIPCWSSSYSEHATVGEILEACTAKEIAFGCRLKGSDTFTVLAHGPRELVTEPLDPVHNAQDVDGYRLGNGSAWQWSTDQLAVFDPAKPWQQSCSGALCWPRIGDTIIPWGRCGDLEMGLESAPKWERVALQSFY